MLAEISCFPQLNTYKPANGTGNFFLPGAAQTN